MAAEGLTLGVAPAELRLPAKYNGFLGTTGATGNPAVSKPFASTAPEIQELIWSVFSLYTENNGAALSKLVQRAFSHDAVFDLPLFFLEGANSMRALAHLMALPFWKVRAQPKLVTVQMLNSSLGRIDVEATLDMYPRLHFFPASLVIPERIQLHGTWSIVAKGDDDRILSVTETIHNIPSLPLLLRRLIATALSTVGSFVGF